MATFADDSVAQLRAVFERYCSFGAGAAKTHELDSAKFMKIFKDNQLLDRNLKQQDVDLIFTRVKKPGARKIKFPEFQAALGEIATKKRVAEDELVDLIVQSAGAGPVIRGTVAEETRFHDDQSTYTGVHKAGGPTIVDRDKPTLDHLLNRGGADIRGVTPAMREAVSSDPRTAKVPSKHRGAADALQAHLSAREEQSATGVPPGRGSSATKALLESKLSHRLAEEPVERRTEPRPPADHALSPEENLEQLYMSFCSAGSTEMESARFVKFCRDTGLLGRGFTVTDADLIFSKAKGRNVKKITYEEFRVSAIPAIAAKKKMSVSQLLTMLREAEGPKLTATVALPTRFHDDRSLYTGVYAQGGPTLVDEATHVTMENLLDRSPADIRGVKYDGSA